MNYQQEKNQEKSSEKNPIPAAETANGRRSGDQGSSSSSSKNQQISIGPNQELVILSGIPNIGNRIPSDDDHAQLLSQGGQNLSVIGFQHQGPPVGIDNSGPNPNPNPNPPRRQISDDFFEFPDMDYISENISALQQEESASATATATANNNAAQTRHAYGGFNQANYNDQVSHFGHQFHVFITFFFFFFFLDFRKWILAPTFQFIKSYQHTIF